MITRIPRTELYRCEKCRKVLSTVNGHGCQGKLGDILRGMLGCRSLCDAAMSQLTRLGTQNPFHIRGAFAALFNEGNGLSCPRTEEAAERILHRALTTLNGSNDG